MTRNDMLIQNLDVILFFLFDGVILIIIGVLILSIPYSITIFILVILYFSSYVFIDYSFVRNIVITCGIVFVVFGFFLLGIGIRIIVKSTRIIL